MRSRGFCSHFRSVAGVFGIVVAGLTGAVIGGDQFDREDRRSGVTAESTAVATPSRAVLQDGSDWLSEGFWQRKRRQKLGSGGSQLGYFSPQFNPFGEADGGARRWERRSVPKQDQGLYRTVCVRLCDGYYFPISFSTKRSRFARDEQVCQSQCSSEARLFYHSSSDPNAEDLRDRDGNRYEDLANAFVYRTTYNRSCQCRPEPWSEEARQRHAAYAAEGADGSSRRVGSATAGARGQVETAAIPVEADADGATPGRWEAPAALAPRMGLGRSNAGAAPVKRQTTSNRRKTNWRSRVFNAMPDGG